MALLRVVAVIHLLRILHVAPLSLQRSSQPDAPAHLDAPARLDPAKLGWLHTPKAGTSFANVLIAWGCPSMLGKMEQETKAMANKFCQHQKKNCSIAHTLCSSHSPIVSNDQDYVPANVSRPWPLASLTASTPENSSHRWEIQKGNFVGMMRKPMQRHMSGYLDRQIMSSFGVPVIHGKYPDAPSYAKANAGCMTKLLSGLPCNDEYKVSDDMVPKAKERLDTGFAYVGLTEEWALSVCLFHKMFGGECSEHEFRNVRPGRAHQPEYDLAPFQNWTDQHDEEVYEHGTEIFWRNIELYGVTRENCGAGVCAKAKRFFD